MSKRFPGGSSGSLKRDAPALNAEAPDHLATCPKCSDLVRGDRATCPACGTKLYLKKMTA